MVSGADVIYQAVFVDGLWRGIADFLYRVDAPSRFGTWRYEAYDTKLARHPKPNYILQLCWYTEQIERLQGAQPRQMHVALGSGEVASYSPTDFLAYFRAVRDRFARALGEQRQTYPNPVSHCRICGYAAHCEQQRSADDHLSLVAGIRRDQIERLNANDVTTVVQLSGVPSGALVGITETTLEKLTRQARLQVEARSAPHRYELLPPQNSVDSLSHASRSGTRRSRPIGGLAISQHYTPTLWRTVL